MNLKDISLRNYRLLSEAMIILNSDKVATVFVGPNNSGKTSVVEALRTFLSGSPRNFSFDDFWAGTHADFDAFEAAVMASTQLPLLPVIQLELGFAFSDQPEDLSVAEDLLMDLDPANSEVVLRIEFCPRSPADISEAFTHYRASHPEGRLTDMMGTGLERLYELRHHKVSIDRKESEQLPPTGVKALLDRLIKVDFLPAQRHMEDQEASGHATKLSRLLHVHYEHRFKIKDPATYAAVQAVVDAQAVDLTTQYGQAFKEVVDALLVFGYPDTPEISVRAELSAGG